MDLGAVQQTSVKRRVREWEIQICFRTGIWLWRLQGSTACCRRAGGRNSHIQEPECQELRWGVSSNLCLTSVSWGGIFGTRSAELCVLLSQAILSKVLPLWYACLDRVAGVIAPLVLADGMEQHSATQECLWEPTKAWSMKTNRQVWRVLWESESWP